MLAACAFCRRRKARRLRSSPPLSSGLHTSLTSHFTHLVSVYPVFPIVALHLFCSDFERSCRKTPTSHLWDPAMAEDVPKGKLPAIAHKPSRLRNQIQPDSSDDELILVPRSDTIIPETQLGHFKHFAGAADKVLGYSNDSEVDYDDSAFLNRVGVKKSTRDGTSQAVLGNLYSKDALMSNPSHSNSFSFEPCKSIGKFPKGGDDCVLQPETNPGFAAHLEPVQGHARNGMFVITQHNFANILPGNITVVTSKVRSQIGNSLNTHEEITGSETKHQTTEPACSPTATPVAYHDTAALNAGYVSHFEGPLTKYRLM